MRVTTRLTPNTCLAIWLDIILRLSPWVAARKASARSMPARLRTSWAGASPRMLVPLKSGPSRLNAEDWTSMIVISWPARTSICATRAPTRPQPMMMMNMRLTYLSRYVPETANCQRLAALGDRVRRSRRGCPAGRGARQPDSARGILQHIRRGMAKVELAKLPLVADTHHDQVDIDRKSTRLNSSH